VAVPVVVPAPELPLEPLPLELLLELLPLELLLELLLLELLAAVGNSGASTIVTAFEPPLCKVLNCWMMPAPVVEADAM
jgi:hypothetical protein